MRFEWTGKAWAARGVFAENCMNNFPPEKLGERLAMVCRDANMDVDMALEEGAGKWARMPIAKEPPFNKMDEPTYYATGNGEVHMIVRDNTRSGFLLRAISTDNGQELIRFTRKEQRVERESLGPVAFVPLLGGMA